MIESVKAAGDTILTLFKSAMTFHTKEKITDIVTEADIKSHEILTDAIRNMYPDHGIVSEESEEYKADAEYVWCIDPLDGSRNFATGVPLFGINLALMRNGTPTHAAICLPATSEVYYAEVGRGAFRNDIQINCSQKKDWKGSYGLVAPDCGPEFIKFLSIFDELSKGTGWINAIASPAVSGVWVADGRRDWYIGPSARNWDYAAPALIGAEAGCAVSNFNGTSWKSGDLGLIVSAPDLHPALLRAVQRCFLT